MKPTQYIILIIVPVLLWITKMGSLIKEVIHHFLGLVSVYLYIINKNMIPDLCITK